MLLVTLKDYVNGSFISQKDIIEISDELSYVRRMIRKYPSYVTDYLSDHEIVSDFEKASNQFGILIVDFVKNQETKIDDTKERLVEYLNIFLKGNLSELPKSESLPNPIKADKVKLYHYFFFGVYLTLPIFIVVSLKVYVNLTLDDYLQSLLKILYVIWIFVGIISNPRIFSNENKDFMKDLVKSFIGKS